MANIFNPISCLVVISVVLINGAIAKDTLFRGQSLNTNEYLENGPYKIIMQENCNLVLYVNQNHAVWSSQTNGRGLACWVTLQINGNLVIAFGSCTVWTSNTGRRFGSYRLIIQTDGNVVIYGGARAVIYGAARAFWATNKVQRKVF